MYTLDKALLEGFQARITVGSSCSAQTEAAFGRMLLLSGHCNYYVHVELNYTHMKKNTCIKLMYNVHGNTCA